MKLLSNLKIPFVILWTGSIGGIIYKTHLDNLQKKKQIIEKQINTNTNFDDPDFNPFRSY